MAEVQINIGINSDTGALESATIDVQSLQEAADALSLSLEDLKSVMDELGGFQNLQGLPDEVASEFDNMSSAADGAANSLNDVSDTANSTSSSMSDLSSNTKDSASATESLASKFAAVRIEMMAMHAIMAMVKADLKLGVEANDASVALNSIDTSALSVNEAIGNSNGLINNLNATKDTIAAIADVSNLTQSQLNSLMRSGSALGQVFLDNSTKGVTDLTKNLAKPGDITGLSALGIDGGLVITEWKMLEAQGVDSITAWRNALLQVASTMTDKVIPQLDNTSGAYNKVAVAAQNFGVQFGKDLADGIGEALLLTNQLQIIYDLINFGSKSSTVDSRESYRLGPGMIDPDKVNQYSDPNAPQYSKPDNYYKYLQGRTYEPPNSSPELTPFGSTTYNLPISNDFSDKQKRINDNLDLADANSLSTAISLEPSIEGFKAHEKLAKLNDHLDQLDNNTSDASKAMQDFKDIISKNRLANTSEGTAFGLVSSPIADQGLTGLTNALTKEEQNLHGRGLTDKDVQVLDAYRIAMGLATSASITFDDAEKLVFKTLAEGKLSPTDAANGIASLTRAAQDGTPAAEKYIKAYEEWLALGAKPASILTTDKGGDRGGGVGTGMPTYTDPLAGSDKSLANSLASVQNLDKELAGIPEKSNKASQQMNQSFDKTASVVEPAVNQINNFNSKLDRSTASVNTLSSAIEKIPATILALQQKSGQIVVNWSLSSTAGGTHQ